MSLYSLFFLLCIVLVASQQADYTRCRLDCASSCGKNGTSCSDCVLGLDCVGAKDQVCLPKNWKAEACPASCDEYNSKTQCGVGCVAVANCGTEGYVCVANGHTSPCGNNETCVRWNSCDTNTSAGAGCCAEGDTCNPDNTYVDCGDCNVVEQKYLEAVCHLEKFLPLWQWILIGSGGAIVIAAVLLAICCCCCKRGKGPQRIEDEEWLMDDNNRW